MALKIIFLLLILISMGCGVGEHMPAPSGSSSLQVTGSENYKGDILPIFQAKCAGCHNPTSPPNQPNWLDYKTAVMYKDEILKRVWVVRDMPPSKDLSDK